MLVDPEVSAPLLRALPLACLLGQPGYSGPCKGRIERGTFPAHSRHARARTHVPAGALKTSWEEANGWVSSAS